MRRDRPITRLLASMARGDRGAIGRIAALAGVDRTTVSHWFAADADRSYSVPVDDLTAVCDALGTVEPLRVLAEELGHDVVPKARPTSSSRPVQEAVWDLLARVADVGTEVAAAARDGRVDDEEARRVRAALQNARDIVDTMLSRLPRHSHSGV